MIPEKIKDFFVPTRNFLVELYNHHIGYYFNHRIDSSNIFISYPEKTKIDRKVWLHMFQTNVYDYKILEIVLYSLDTPYGTLDYCSEYNSANSIRVFFKDEDTLNKVFNLFEDTRKRHSTVLEFDDFLNSNFDRCHGEIINPEAKNIINIIPNRDKLEELSKLLIDYYLKNNYTLTKNIFNEKLCVMAPDKIYFTLFVESESMAAELSMLLMTNNLATILEADDDIF